MSYLCLDSGNVATVELVLELFLFVFDSVLEDDRSDEPEPEVQKPC